MKATKFQSTQALYSW